MKIKVQAGTRESQRKLLVPARAIVLPEFYARACSAGRNGEIHISHKSVLFCAFCSSRSRAINELTRKLPRVFRDHNSALSNPPRLLRPSPPLTEQPSVVTRKLERNILGLKDIYELSNRGIGRERKIDREISLSLTKFYFSKEGESFYPKF